MTGTRHDPGAGHPRGSIRRVVQRRRAGSLQKETVCREMQNAMAGCEELGIPYLDLTGPLVAHPTAKTFFAFDGHFNRLGHRVVADALLEACPFLRAIAGRPSR